MSTSTTITTKAQAARKAQVKAQAGSTKSTLAEVNPDIHHRLRAGAAKTGNSMKRFTALLLDYALTKFEAGEITLRDSE